MTRTRIEPLVPPYAPDVQETLRRLMPEGMEPIALFRTVAHNPRVLQRLQRGGLLDRGSISLRQREIAILRTTALLGAEYEWGVHIAAFGDAAKLTPAERHATVHGTAGDEVWADDERLILRLVDALHAQGTIDDALFQALAAHFTSAQLVELSMLAGLYHAVSFIVNVSGVAPELWAARWTRPNSSAVAAHSTGE